MVHYSSAKRVVQAMNELTKLGEFEPQDGYDFPDDLKVEVRTKDYGTQTFEVDDVAMGVKSTLWLERNGQGVIVDACRSERGKFKYPARMRLASEDYADAERTQVMEITILD